MKKKFVKVMFYGAIALATSTSFVGCADYDDDVQNLQNQIDEINKKSPLVSVEEMTAAINSAIQQLEEKLNGSINGNAEEINSLKTLVGQLQEALNNKADKTQIEDILKQIADLSKQIDEKTAAAAEAAKAELEAQIKELEEKLANADEATKEELTQQILDLKNEMQDLMNEKASEILENCVQIQEFNNLKNIVEELQEANKNFATKGELEAYVSKEELNKLLDDKILAELQEGGDIYKTINEIITSTIASRIEGIYVTMEDYNKKIQELTEQMNKYATQEGLDQLKDKVSKLEETLIALQKSVGQNEKDIAQNAKDIADLAQDVTDLRDDLSGYLTQTDKAALENAIKEANDKIKGIEDKLKELGIVLESMQAMIQSIQYVPAYEDGKVMFNKLRVKNPTTGATNVILLESNQAEIKFRVSPAAAVKDFENKYTVSFEGSDEPLKTRTTTNAGKLKIISTTCNENEGTVTFTVNHNMNQLTNGTYALCAHISAKKAAEGEEATGDQFTDITSDYFMVVKDEVIVEKVALTNIPAEREIWFDDASSKISFANVKYELYDTNNNLIKAANYNAEQLASVISIAYTPTNSQNFKFNGTDLVLNSYTPSMDGKTTQVKAVVKLNGVAFNLNANELMGSEVITATRKSMETNVTYSLISQEWWNVDKEYTLDLNKLYNEAQVTASEIESQYNVESLKVDGRDVAFNNTQETITLMGNSGNITNGLKVRVKAETGAKANGSNYVLKLTLKNPTNNRTIVLTQEIRITYDQLINDYKFQTDPALWKGDKNNGTLILTPQGSGSSINYRYEVFNAFTDFQTLINEVYSRGGSISYQFSDGLYNTSFEDDLTGNTIRIKPEVYDVTKHNITVEYYITFGGKVTETAKASLLVKNVSGSWTANAQQLNLTLDNLKNKVELWKTFSWKAALDNSIMWGNKNGSFNPGNDGILQAYGLTAPTFVLSEGANKFFRINTNGELEYIGGAEGFVQEYKFTIEVKAQSRWGSIEGYDGKHTITVTVPAGMNLN